MNSGIASCGSAIQLNNRDRHGLGRKLYPIPPPKITLDISTVPCRSCDYLRKAKPIVRWGQKATGLEKDSRVA